MVQGFERREAVQDLNPQKAMQADSVPLQNVMSPQPSGMGSVTDPTFDMLGGLADALKKPLADFTKKYQDKSVVEGELLYAQGKTEQEVAESGNSFTMQGFQTMQAKVQSDSWYNAKMAEIEETAHQIDPTEYRRALSAELQPMLDAVSDADPSIKHFVVNTQIDNMTKLVSQQVRSHSKWKHDQTISSGTQLIDSERTRLVPNDPDGLTKVSRVHTMLGVATAGLNTKDRNQVLGNALQLAAIGGDTATRDAVMLFLGAQPGKSFYANTQIPDIVESVAVVESGGKDYNADGTPVTSPAGAKYRMQVLPSTAAKPGFGIKPATGDTPEEYNRVGVELLNVFMKRYNNPVLAVMAYNAGHAALDTHLAKGDPRTNPAVTWDTFVGTFTNAQGDPKQTQKYIDKLKPFMEGADTRTAALEHGEFLNALVRGGFEPDQIAGLSNTYERLYKDKAVAFSEDKFKTEQSILDTAAADGNFDAALKRVRAEQTRLNLPDEWANAISRKLPGQVEEYQRKVEQQNKLSYAVATSRVDTLSSKEQDAVIKLNRAKVQGELDAKITAGQLDKNAAVGELIAQSIQFAHRNHVVDKDIAADIRAGVIAPFYDKDGKVSPETLTAFELYKQVRSIGGKAYADKYAGDDADLLDDAYRFSGVLGNPDTALLSARQRRDAIVNPSLSSDKPKYSMWNKRGSTTDYVQQRIDEFIDNVDVGYFSSLFSDAMLGPAQIFGTEVDRAKNSPQFRAFVQDTYKAFHDMGLRPEEVENQVKNVIDSRVDFVLGEPIITGEKNLRTLAGVPNARPDAINWAAQEALKVRIPGRPIWKDKVMDFQLTGSKDTVLGAPTATFRSIRELARGVPETHVQLDLQANALVFRPWLNKEHTEFADDPIVVPLAELGKRISMVDADNVQPASGYDWLKWGVKPIGTAIKRLGGFH